MRYAVVVEGGVVEGGARNVVVVVAGRDAVRGDVARDEKGGVEKDAAEDVRHRRPSEFGCSIQHLALAWLAVNPNTSTIILGAS